MTLSWKTITLSGFIFALLVGIPLSVFLVRQQQNTESHAQKSTTLDFTPASTQAAPLQVSAGSTVKLNIKIDPGVNSVDYVKLDIEYDATKLATDSATPFVADPSSSLAVMEGPVYTPGKIVLTLSAGADPTKVLQSVTTIGTLSFKALTATADPTLVVYGQDTQVLSTAGTDQTSENVLSSTNPAAIKITAGGTTQGTPTPTTAGGIPTPTGSQIPTMTPRPVTVAPNQPPACTALNADRQLSGNAPFSATFTAIGNDFDGSIQKATINFGDGPVTDVTVGGGIGTASVNAQATHTYNNPGTYQVSAIMTDNKGAVSEPSTCSKTVIVTQAPATGTGGTAGGGTTGGGTTAGGTTKGGQAIPATGPGDTFVLGAAVTAIITVIGGILFFAL